VSPSNRGESFDRERTNRKNKQSEKTPSREHKKNPLKAGTGESAGGFSLAGERGT
jgi:hypothetical protein